MGLQTMSTHLSIFLRCQPGANALRQAAGGFLGALCAMRHGNARTHGAQDRRVIIPVAKGDDFLRGNA